MMKADSKQEENENLSQSTPVAKKGESKSEGTILKLARDDINLPNEGWKVEKNF